MQVTKQRLFPYSVEVTPASLETFFRIIDGVELGVNAEAVLKYVSVDGHLHEAPISELLNIRNEKEKRLIRVSLSKSANECSVTASLGWNEQSSVACVYAGPPDFSPNGEEFFLTCEQEVRNISQWYSFPGLLREWLENRPAIRVVFLLGFLLFFGLWASDVIGVYRAERHLSEAIQTGLLDKADEVDLNDDTAAGLERIREFLSSGSLRSEAVKRGVPFGTIMRIGVQVLWFAFWAVLLVLWGRLFPKTQFAIGEGRERADRLRRWQHWAIGLGVSAALLPIIRSVWPPLS